MSEDTSQLFMIARFHGVCLTLQFTTFNTHSALSQAISISTFHITSHIDFPTAILHQKFHYEACDGRENPGKTFKVCEA